MFVCFQSFGIASRSRPDPHNLCGNSNASVYILLVELSSLYNSSAVAVSWSVEHISSCAALTRTQLTCFRYSFNHGIFFPAIFVDCLPVGAASSLCVGVESDCFWTNERSDEARITSCKLK